MSLPNFDNLIVFKGTVPYITPSHCFIFHSGDDYYMLFSIRLFPRFDYNYVKFPAYIYCTTASSQQFYTFDKLIQSNMDSVQTRILINQ